MKAHKRYLLIAVAVLSLFLSGCGTAVYELEAEEEALIVQSAAYFVAKHNIQQKDGMSGLYVTDEMLNPEAETQTDTQVETETGTETQNEGNGEGSTDGSQVEDGISLAAAIGHASDLQVAYMGSYTTDHYMEGEAYSVDAAAGCTLYIMKFNVTNTTKEAVEVNNVSKNLTFKLTSDSLTVKSEVTFLEADLSMYLGTIKAGETVETILLFEVPEAKAEGISNPTLQIMIDNEIKKVKL